MTTRTIGTVISVNRDGDTFDMVLGPLSARGSLMFKDVGHAFGMSAWEHVGHEVIVEYDRGNKLSSFSPTIPTVEEANLRAGVNIKRGWAQCV